MTVEYYNGLGRRKRAVARVRLYPGEGDIIVNDKDANEYFSRGVDRSAIEEPLLATELRNKFNIMVKVRGGGVTGQAGATRMGIARALLKYDENLRSTLRRGGFLTRDPREKERKKPGLPRARKDKQYTKR